MCIYIYIYIYIRLEAGKNNNYLLQLKVSCFQSSGKMILFY